jgi:hypothetical protein
VRRYWVGAIAVLLLAAGFAVASIATGAGLSSLQATTGTTTSHKVIICHRTKSKKHPFVQISVDVHAVPAHLKHGDTEGPCTKAQLTAGKKKSKKSSSTTTSSSTGPGNSAGHGNGGGNGNGKGHGK